MRTFQWGCVLILFLLVALWAVILWGIGNLWDIINQALGSL